ncbi:MAG TPA: TAXI family TRAP transporter solute-binding subunit [Methylibium sp.]|nr:TAXI family TRAP transporter solute-binding subunit [Methylibium sp.]
MQADGACGAAPDRLPMPRLSTLRATLLSTRDLIVTAGPFVLLVVGLLLLAYWVLDPTPPKKLVLATGPEQGAYAEFGARYKAQLAKFGVQVELRGTQGSAENLRLLQDPASGVDFAFVQGGAGRLSRAEGPPEGLLSLGSLFHEPIWIFYREAAATEKLSRTHIDKLADLKGWRVNIGAPGSGITNMMRRLLDANGLEDGDIDAQRLPQTEAVVALFDGRLDAVAFASAPEAPLVQMLLLTQGIGLLDFAQAEAYARRLPILAPVTLPRGIVKLEADLPPADVRLVAPTAMLVARDDTHPALQQLLVQAARAIHGDAGWFQKRGDFPNARNSELPLAKEAERFFQSGPPFLQRYLPFWVANLVDRMWVVLASIIVVLIPLSRIVPPLYELRVRSRVFRWYGKLRQIEDGVADADEPHEAQALMDELEGLDARVRRLNVPLSHADELYALRGHIDLVRGKLRALGAEAAPETATPPPASTTTP